MSCLYFRFCLTILILGAGCGVSEILPPEKVAFNFPPPPRNGRQDYFSVTEKGEARCCIVLPAKRKLEEVRAARVLSFYIERSTGAKLRIFLESDEPPEGLGQIHVGETSVSLKVGLDIPSARYGETELPNVNGYLIKSINEETLLACETTPQATVFAVVGLLKRYFGVRRYWPGQPGGIGDVVPKHESLKLPEIEWRDWPHFISRIMSGVDDRGPKNTAEPFVRFRDFWRLHYTIPSNESYYRLMKTSEHLDEPKLFPLIGGKRFIPKVEKGKRIPHGWQPCVSNPDVAGIMSDSILENFHKKSDQIAESLSVNDGLGDCTCENCRALDSPDADLVQRTGLSDRYATFNNRVAEKVAGEFPNRILAFLGYGSLRFPPKKVQLHPSLMPVLCVGGNTFQMWDDWMKTGAKHMGIYLYHDDLWFILPKLDIHQSAKRIRYIVGSGRARHFYQEFYGIYLLDGMVGYVETELAWDPRLHEDALLDEYYALFFRDASDSMKSFYETVEEGYEQWLDKEGEPHPYGKDISSMRGRRSLDQFAVLPIEMADKATGYLDQALKEASEDSPATDRVKLVKLLFEFALPGIRQYWALERLKNVEVDSEKSASRVVVDAREVVGNGLALSVYKEDFMETPPAKLYADHRTRDEFYNNLKRGAVGSRILTAIGDTFRSVTLYLKAAKGPKEAEGWWHHRIEEETLPLLKRLMQVEAFEAGTHQLVNLVADPSFEDRGTKKPTSNADELPPEAQMRQGLRLWQSAGTPMNCKLTNEKAHSGKFSVLFWDTNRATVLESISAEAKQVFKLSVWVNHNKGGAEYEVVAIPRSSKRMLSRSTIPVPGKPGEWQQVEFTFTAPPETKTLGLYVFAHRQSPGAKIWVDDFFIGRYPD